MAWMNANNVRMRYTHTYNIYVMFSLQSSELLTSLTVTLDMLGSELVRFAENESFTIDSTGIGWL